MQNFISELAIVQDPRTGNAKKHKLSDILFIAIAAGVADCNTWNEIEDYAIAHEAFFRKYLELPAGIPSHDTFNRVFAIMDPIVMEQNYQEWIRSSSKSRKNRLSALTVSAFAGRETRMNREPAMPIC